MDTISIIAIIVGLCAIIGGQTMEGGNIDSLLQWTAFLIVIGGTASAVMLQSTARQFLTGIKMIRWVFQTPPNVHEEMISEVITWSKGARRGGLLSLENYINAQPDPFTQKALQMLVDGTDPETIRAIMNVELSMFEHSRKQSVRIWESAGGYAPTMGILGAVLGLIHVMQNLGDPSKLGAGIAVAFVATVYGVGSANLLFLPIANKLKHIIAGEIAMKELIVEGIIAIASGENPRIIESRLRGFIAMHE